MAELLNSKRVIFPKGQQRQFILQTKKELNITWEILAGIANTSVRNLMGWKNEKNSMSLLAVKNICGRRKCNIPKNIEVRNAYWYVIKGAKAGGEATYVKYRIIGGDQEVRKKKWREWWEQEGKFKQHSITQPASFRKPEFSEDLAEFVGIVLGDGATSERQIAITLHRVTDKEYLRFVRKLIRSLFRVPVGVYRMLHALADTVIISRTGLVRHCTENLGLKKGHKIRQQVDIPLWVKKNLHYSTACLRGLMDTDGCVIIHRYNSNGKIYTYKKMAFTSMSSPLLRSVGDILSQLDIKYRVTNNGYDVRIEATEQVKRYFEKVGTHNPKHLKRYRQ